MNICVDVGNTTIAFSGYVDGVCKHRNIINNDKKRSEDEYYNYLKLVLSFCEPPIIVENVIYSSVVPEINTALKGALFRLFNVPIKTINLRTDKVGFKFYTDNPYETGDDLVADLVAGYHFYGYPLLIVDLGTASKVLYLDEEGRFASANILPGLELCRNSLCRDTSLLPNIELTPVDSVFSKNTLECINTGVVIGQIEMLNGFISRYKKETNNENLKVVFTGGYTYLLKDLISKDYEINPNLTMDGLNKLIELNK